MKVCNKCQTERPKSEFSKQAREPDGLRRTCKVCIAVDTKAYYEKNKEIMLTKQKSYRSALKASNENYNKDRNIKYKDKIKTYKAEYYKKNKAKIIAHNNSNQLIRRKTDDLYRLACNIRTLIGGAIRNGGYSKNTKTTNILGCSFEEFKVHIESQFTEGMCWDNRDLWHLDHIYPVSRAENEDHLIDLNHYTNFQPLWAEDNIKKGNKIL